MKYYAGMKRSSVKAMKRQRLSGKKYHATPDEGHFAQMRFWQEYQLFL